MKHGWILQASNGKFVNDIFAETTVLKDAMVLRTRSEARTGNEVLEPLDDDVVRKVSLYKNGKAKKIIGRG